MERFCNILYDVHSVIPPQLAQNKDIRGRCVIHVSSLQIHVFNRYWRNSALMGYIVWWIWISYHSSIIPALHESLIESCILFKAVRHTKYRYKTLMPLGSLSFVRNILWCYGIATEIQQTIFSDSMQFRRHPHHHVLGPLIPYFSSKFGYFNFQLTQKIPNICVGTEILVYDYNYITHNN